MAFIFLRKHTYSSNTYRQYHPYISGIWQIQSNFKFVIIEEGSYSLHHYNDSTYATEISFFPDTSDEYKSLINLRNDTLILLPEVISIDGYFLAYSKQ